MGVVAFQIIGSLVFLALLYVVIKRAIKDAFRELDEERQSRMAFRR